MVTAKNKGFWLMAQTGCTPLAWGAPGTCKTQTTYAFGRAVERPVYTLIGSLRDCAEIGGYPYPGEIQVTTESLGQQVVMRLVPPEWALRCHDGRPWIIFIDELTTCAPAVQAALLRVIAERVVGDLALPEKTWILCAANPPELAANGVDLEPPMANRLVHFDWEMDWDNWDQGLLSGLSFPEPTFPRLPADWKKHLPKFGSLVSAFRRVKPGAMLDLPKDRSRQCKAWPSPRSWTNAVLGMAAAHACNESEDVRHAIVAGCIGEPAAIEFAQWVRNLDLPNPEELLKTAMAAVKAKKPMEYQHPDRADKVIAMLSSVVAAVTEHKTQERWNGLLAILERVADVEVDIAACMNGPIARLRDKSWRYPEWFYEKMHGRLAVLMEQ